MASGGIATGSSNDGYMAGFAVYMRRAYGSVASLYDGVPIDYTDPVAPQLERHLLDVVNEASATMLDLFKDGDLRMDQANISPICRRIENFADLARLVGSYLGQTSANANDNGTV